MRLSKAYDALLDSFAKTSPASTIPVSARFSVQSFSDVFQGHNLWKFVSAAAIMLLFSAVALFAKYPNWVTRVAALLFLLLVSFLLGLIGALIPTFSPLILNLLGVPLVEFALIIYIGVIAARAAAKRAQAGQKPKEAAAQK